MLMRLLMRLFMRSLLRDYEWIVDLGSIGNASRKE